jgi:hypothetical protein
VTEARLILTCGLPGAGKTALARQLAADRSAVRLTKDEWLWALGSTPWDEPTREKVEHELWRLAQEILSLGLSVVLDFGLWARAERDELRSVARGLGVGVELHYLECVPVPPERRRGMGFSIGAGSCPGSEQPWEQLTSASRSRVGRHSADVSGRPCLVGRYRGRTRTPPVRGGRAMDARSGCLNNQLKRRSAPPSRDLGRSET